MVRFLVIKGDLVPISDIIFIILTFLGTIIFFIAWIYMVFNNNCTNSKTLIKSTSRLPMNYQGEIDYYYMYDRIKFDFNNESYYLANDIFSEIKVNYGRNVENDFEILVDDKYRKFINKKILLNINNELYEFLIVGTYKSTNIYESKKFYVTGSTIDYFSNYPKESYYYMFISDEYPLLNEDLDFFSRMGYEVEIIPTNMFDDFYTYRVKKDTFLMASVMLVFMFGIYVFDIYFLE